MKSKTLLLLLFLVCILASIVSASEIIVEDADDVWKAEPKYQPELRDATTEILPMVLVKHADSNTKLNLSSIPQELANKIAEVPSSLLVDHADSNLKFNLISVPTELDSKITKLPSSLLVLQCHLQFS